MENKITMAYLKYELKNLKKGIENLVNKNNALAYNTRVYVAKKKQEWNKINDYLNRNNFVYEGNGITGADSVYLYEVKAGNDLLEVTFYFGFRLFICLKTGSIIKTDNRDVIKILRLVPGVFEPEKWNNFFHKSKNGLTEDVFDA